MSEVTHPELTRAYQLIEQDELDQARALLDAYLETDQNNPDAWWLYAHAVTDPLDAQDALRNLLRIDPNYPGARGLLLESEAALTPTRAPAASGGISRLSSRPVTADDLNSPPDFLDDFDEDGDFLDDDEEDLFQQRSDADLDDDFDGDFDDDTAEEPAPAARSRLFTYGLITLVMVLALIIAAVLLNNRDTSNNRSSANATGTAAAMLNPTGTIAGVSPTNLSPTDVPSETTTQDIVPAEPFAGIYEALAGYQVVPGSAAVEQTSAGNTFLISICNDPDAGIVTTALGTVELVAQQAPSLAGQADYAGVRIVDCARNNLTLRRLAVSLVDAEAFAAGSLSAVDLRSRLIPIQ